MNKPYQTIDGCFENTVIIEKSKFICYLYHIESEQEARDIILEVRKKHSLATHVCYSFIADKDGLNQKFSDDGEPQGTAGMPMLDVLKNYNLKKILTIVVRYFGGVKLGTGGLVRAYSGSVIDCINLAKIKNYYPSYEFEFDVDFKLYSKVLSYISGSADVKIIDSVFNEYVTIKVSVKQDRYSKFNEDLCEILSSKIIVKNNKEKYTDF